MAHTAASLSSLLSTTLERELPHLLALDDAITAIQPGGPDSWSPKQELGHLLDSAVNNHVRFVSAALADGFAGPNYAQNEWVRLHDYQNLTWKMLVDTWAAHNRMLVRLLANIPDARFASELTVGGSAATLGFVAEDYVLHLQHHVDHLLAREVVTLYPAEKQTTTGA